MKFRKKPVVIEAIQWTGDNYLAVNEWCQGAIPRDVLRDTLQIRTLEGVMTARVGDWVIRGVSGEFYPCKPDIFAATYEAVDEYERPAPTEMPGEPERRA